MNKESGYFNKLKPACLNDLVVINLVTIILLVNIALFPSFPLRSYFGFPFILLFPGYVLLVALFPRKSEMSGIIRPVLSFVLSISLTGLISLALNATPWGIRLESILYSLASGVFIISIVAWFRQRRLLPNERYGYRSLKISISFGAKAWDKALTIILVLVAMGAVGTMIFAIFTPRTGQTFTEFYILGVNNTPDYPQQVKIGVEANVLLGMVNHEAKTTVYSVVINIEGLKVNEIGPVTLASEEKWENKVSFVIDKTGNEQKVEFILYKDGDQKPYMEPLRLWVNVTY